MKITELRIGDRVQEKNTRFPMTVVGLYSTLDDLKSGMVDLDFEGNEGDVWIHKPEELERADSQSTDWDKVRINAAIVNMQTLMAQSWQMEADEVAKVAVEYADALIKELKENE
jgi:hypothetical protein